MLGRVQLVQIERLADVQRGQELIFLLAGRRQDASVAVEAEDLALGLEPTLTGTDLDVRDLEDRRGHLAGDEAAIDQVVELVLIDAQSGPDRLGRQREVGRSDRLVSFLGQLAGGVEVRLGWQVLVAVFLADQIANAVERLVRDPQGVGSHVGDQADRPGAVHVDAFVKLLGDFHRPLAGEAQSDRALLLERAGLERGVGLIPLFHGLQLIDGVGRADERVADCEGVGLVRGGELGSFPLGQLGGESVGLLGGAGRAERGGDPPVLLGDEGPDLLLPLGDQADGHRLNPTRAQAAGNFFPE